MFPEPRPRHLDDYTDPSTSREESDDDSCGPTPTVAASVPTKVDVDAASDAACATCDTAASAPVTSPRQTHPQSAFRRLQLRIATL
eukprot:3993715-Pleurochrysis_carterae.AAC.2